MHAKRSIVKRESAKGLGSLQLLNVAFKRGRLDEAVRESKEMQKHSHETKVCYSFMFVNNTIVFRNSAIGTATQMKVSRKHERIRERTERFLGGKARTSLGLKQSSVAWNVQPAPQSHQRVVTVLGMVVIGCK